MIEDQVRSHLEELSRDVPDIEAMRRRVRRELSVSARPPKTERVRWSLLIAACVAAIAGLLIVADLRADNESLVATRDVVGSADPTRMTIQIDGVGVSLVPPIPEPAVEHFRDNHAMLPLGEAGPDASWLHVISLEGSTADVVVSSIVESATDTTILESSSIEIDGRPGRRLVMESGRGTSRVGFQLDFTTFLSTMGIGRHHEVIVVEVGNSTVARTIAIWADTASDGEAERMVAQDVIASLELVQSQ